MNVLKADEDVLSGFRVQEEKRTFAKAEEITWTFPPALCSYMGR
jgi:hypothetical protein